MGVSVESVSEDCMAGSTEGAGFKDLCKFEGLVEIAGQEGMGIVAGDGGAGVELGDEGYAVEGMMEEGEAEGFVFGGFDDVEGGAGVDAADLVAEERGGEEAEEGFPAVADGAGPSRGDFAGDAEFGEAGDLVDDDAIGNSGILRKGEGEDVGFMAGVGEGSGAVEGVGADAAEADAGPLGGKEGDAHGGVVPARRSEVERGS
jgi:hypothetical protein